MNGLNSGGNQKYLLTGATGFLGSHIMAGLLKRHERLVIFGRRSGSISLQERIRKLLNWFNIGHLEELLEFYETDFMTNRLGLGKEEYDSLCSRGLAIIHCASDTSFAEKNRGKIMRSNVESLAEILNFASRSRAAWFHFISTAFAAGIDSAECR
ncbi:MAG TPA: SDR family oxidoreductase, partial [Bacteroidales bacterium]|nr:SDR family oxidoreductase [Bacteroidales bacterium]